MLNVSRIYYNGINNLIALLNKAKDKLDKKQEVANPFLFDDLSPEDEITNGETYFKALKWALENKDVQNIALSGPYGSGKSSVLRSFEKKHPEYKYLNISLASFRDGANDGKAQTSLTPEEFRLIEISILQQMFYKVKASAIPDSRFKRIRSINKYFLALYILLAIASGLSILILFEPAFLNHLDFWKKIEDKNAVWLTCLFFIAITVSTITKYLIRLFNSKQFEKISLSTGEIEMGAGNEKSILNKHLDEIIYFFSKNPFTVVTIEDLDRFNTHDIFTKLRELNLLINLSRPPENKIKFIYAIKDDIFQDKTRTKFFDFIVPVLPVVNSSNSYAVLRNKIDAQKTLKISVNDNFIRDITLFIDDMRILKNIFNEFILYQQNLRSLSLNHNTLLGIIIYKNVYPDDFAALHENKGLVFKAFNLKTVLKLPLSEKNRARIEEINALIEKVKNENLKNLTELRAVYIHKIFSLADDGYAINLPEKNITLAEALDEEWFLKLKNSGSLRLERARYSTFNTGKTFKDIELMIDPDNSFDERKILIKVKTETTIANLQFERADLIKEINLLQSYSLKELFDNYPACIDQLPTELLDRKLLVYLLREGYINEMYPSVITYFYEGGLMQNDMDFLLGIKNNISNDLLLKITKFDEVVKSITLLEYRRESALNISLLNHLLENRERFYDRIDSLVFQFNQVTKPNVRFFQLYLSQGMYPGIFINVLSEKIPDLWINIERLYNLSDEEKKLIIRLLIINVNTSAIVNLNKESTLSNYINSMDDFLSIVPENQYAEKIIELVEALDLSFSNLDLPDTENEVFNYIYENYHYGINEAMLRLIIKHKSSTAFSESTFISKNYTTIQESGCTYLIEYVDEKIETYIKSCFLLIEPNDDEPAEVVIDLLNKEEIPIELKKKIIEKEKTIIDDIGDIPEELWQHSLENKKAKISWENLVNYCSSIEEMDDTLINILNDSDNFEILGKTKILPAPLPEGTSGDAAERLMAKDIVTNEKLSDMSLQYLVNAIPYEYDALDCEDISDSKLTILILAGKYLLTPPNFDYLKARLALKLKLLEKYPTVFSGQVSSFNPETIDIHAFLQSGNVESVHKELLIENVSANLLVNQEELADLIVDLIKNTNVKLQFEKISVLFINARNLEYKLIYLNNIIPDLREEECRQLLTMLPEPYSQLAEKGRRPSFPNTPVNLGLISSLHHQGYILSFKINEKEERVKVVTKTADSI